MHSFAYKVKNELCRAHVQRQCCARAEAYGALLYCNTFDTREIRIITENPDFAARLPRLFKRAFDLRFDRLPEEGEHHGKLVFQINDPDKLNYLMEAYGFDPEKTLALHVNLPVLEEECCKTAFLRGAFLAGGSVTDPGKGYHLEMATAHQAVARETFSLLGETMGFDPKRAQRSGSRVLYLKNSDLISDYLTYIGAPVSAMGIMEAKLEKELKNRQTGKETGNNSLRI